MKKGSDPTMLFEKLAAIEDQYGDIEGGVSKMDLIAIVLDAATDEYQSVLTAEQSARGTNLTLLDLELVMNKYYRQMVRRRGVKKAEDHEVLLAGFSGACFSCGKKGHRANKCPEREPKEKANDKKTNKVCINCGKRGHIAKDCWFKSANNKPRATDSTNKQSMRRENAAVGIDKEANSDISEYLLGSIDLSVLNDNDIWIADTAVTVHMTPHRERLESIRNITANAITMGNGTTEVVTESGDLFGEIKSKGKTSPIRIQDVTIMPNGTFNLFSVSQALSKGWEMEGNKNETTLKKGKCELKFDLKISTSKGVLYATKIARRSEICGTIGDLTPKVENRGHICMFVGYPDNHASDTYRM